MPHTDCDDDRVPGTDADGDGHAVGVRVVVPDAVSATVPDRVAFAVADGDFKAEDVRRAVDDTDAHDEADEEAHGDGDDDGDAEPESDAEPVPRAD